MNVFLCDAQGDYAREDREKIFLCSFQFFGKSLRPLMSQLLHVVFFVPYVVNLFVSIHLKHLLEDEVDLPLETSAFLHWLQV